MRTAGGELTLVVRGPHGAHWEPSATPCWEPRSRHRWGPRRHRGARAGRRTPPPLLRPSLEDASPAAQGAPQRPTPARRIDRATRADALSPRSEEDGRRSRVCGRRRAPQPRCTVAPRPTGPLGVATQRHRATPCTGCCLRALIVTDGDTCPLKRRISSRTGGAARAPPSAESGSTTPSDSAERARQ